MMDEVTQNKQGRVFDALQVMRKLLCAGVLATFSATMAMAQHCPFDGAGIIVLQVHSADSAGIIPGLKIYLLDSHGQPFNVDRYKEAKWMKDTAYFWQNAERTTFTGYIDNNNPAEPEKIRFPFARNNYILTTYSSFPLDKCKIVIEDGDGAKNGSFEKKVISLKSEDVYPLCTTYNKEVYNCPFKKIVYAPADVILARKN